jgi:putative sigma-54 modulation protein
VKLTITGRHLEVTPNLHRHIETRIEKLSKFTDHIIEGEIVLFKDHVDEVAEGKIHIGNTLITAKARSTDMYESVSDLIDKLLIQLQRHDGKLRDRKHHDHPREL